MENPESKYPSPGEKISMVDLLVVLLKYRKMIIGITASVLCAALAGYFIYPPHQFRGQPKPAVREGEFRTVMAASLIPGADHFLPRHQFGFFFRKPDIVIKALEDSNIIFSREKTEDWILPLHGAYRDGNKEEKIYKSPNGKLTVEEYLETGVVEFQFLGPGAGEGIVFLNNLFILGNEAAAASVKSSGGNYGGAFDIFIEPYTVNAESDARHVPRSLADFQKAYRSRALLFVLAALFFSVFLAFFANVINDIKNDKDSLEKIRNVLKPLK
jgi:hypothetical protein